jgi:hypothetical protein
MLIFALRNLMRSLQKSLLLILGIAVSSFTAILAPNLSEAVFDHWMKETVEVRHCRCPAGTA